MRNNHYLFCPVPEMAPDCLGQMLCRPDMCRGALSIEEIIQNTEKNLFSVYQADDTLAILLITGAGIAVNVTVISCRFRPEGDALLSKNGELIKELEAHFEIYADKTTSIKYNSSTVPDISGTENEIKSVCRSPDALKYH